jgi:aminopeptidase N
MGPMPSVRARAFQVTFEQALARGGRFSRDDIQALESAAKSIKDPKEKRAANDVLALVRHDRILDETEVAPARKALCRLLGVSSARLPARLEKVLTHAVPVPNVRVKSYDLTFDFKEDKPSFPARAVIELEAPAPARTVLEIDPDRLDIDEVRVGGRRVSFTVKDGRLLVDAEGARRLDVRYRVTPTTDTKSYGLIRDRYAGRMWTLTWPYNTGALFPSSSRPDDGATARVTVHVKAGEQVIGPGAQKDDGAFHLEEPVPAYAISFTTGAFTDNGVATSKKGHEARTVGLGKQVTPALRKEVRSAVADAMDFLSTWLGPYPVGKRLNIVEIKSEYGGMEHAGAVAVTVGQSRKDTLEAAVHETVHHWFGDGVHIAHWGELWMSEGFTNYATWRFFRTQDGEAAFHGYLDTAKEQLKDTLKELGAGATHPLTNAPHVDPMEGLTLIPYMQGGWMLRMIEARIGTAKMDRLLKGWVKAKRGTAVTTRDFMNYAKKKHEVDLEGFFRAWGHLEKVPTFADRSRIRGERATLELQAKGPVPEGIAVPVLVEGPGGKSARFVVAPGAPLEIEAGFRIARLRWDPDRTVLCDVVS